METTDYVSFPIALALKKAGFDWKCHYHYDSDRGSHIIEPNYTANDGEDCQYITADDLLEDNNGWQYCSAPTLAHAQKWLREEWDLHIDVYPVADCSLDADGNVCEEWNYWTYDIMHVISTRKIVEDEEQYGSYEEALSEGIKSVLELIKKGE